MMKKKTIGLVLLWLGFVSGALATVWNAPGKGVEFAKTLKSQEQADEITSQNIIWSTGVSALMSVGPVDGQDSDAANKNSVAAEKDSEVKLAKSVVDYGKQLSAVKVVTGFVPRDISSVEPPVDGWHLVNWTWYGISAAIGVLGILLIRLDAGQTKVKSEETHANVSDLKNTLQRLSTKVEQLAKESKVLPPSQILGRIDEDLTDDFLSFAEGRESITTEHGLAVYADVMSNFSSGERSVNRAWSAAADGYVNEAEQCLERATKMLQAANEVLVEAHPG